MAEPVETEIKLRVAAPEEARRALASVGARLTRERHFEDNVVYDDAAGSLLGGGRLLRVRRTDAGGVVTFKGPRRLVEGVKSREELETALADAGAFEAILAALGYRPVFRYQKYREAHAWGEVEIVVDETPIGTFLEIEGPVAEIHRAAAALGYGPADYVTESYGALHFAAGGTGDMVFEEGRDP